MPIQALTRIEYRDYNSPMLTCLLCDHLGSTSVMVNADGTQVSGSPQGASFFDHLCSTSLTADGASEAKLSELRFKLTRNEWSV
jgi:hypothetical protein